MHNVLSIYKPIGQTPLQAIELLRKKHPELKDKKLGYAGRLDPMAEGLLLILVGEENKKRKEYERLPKEYEFEVLFGIATDSYDVLGLITSFWQVRNERDQNHSKVKPRSQILESSLTLLPRMTKELLGKQMQPYPPYSAARVAGHPLYWWAREGKINEITIPEKEIEIYEFDYIDYCQLRTAELRTIVIERINKVRGQFRQEEILQCWQDFFQKHQEATFPIFKFKISCSSGTYVRSIAHEFGQKFNITSLTFSIKRTKIGTNSILT